MGLQRETAGRGSIGIYVQVPTLITHHFGCDLRRFDPPDYLFNCVRAHFLHERTLNPKCYWHLHHNDKCVIHCGKSIRCQFAVFRIVHYIYLAYETVN